MNGEDTIKKSSAGRGVGRGSIAAAMEEIHEEISRIGARVAEIEADRTLDADERERVVRELQARSSVLTGKYVLAHRLLESLGFSELMAAIREVLESLVGLSSFAVYWSEGPEKDLLLCTVEPPGVTADARLRPGDGPVGSVALRGRSYLARVEERRFTEPPTPIGWFPLLHEGEERGGIAVFEMLSHKKGFEAGDLELLEMLSEHAGEAILDASRRVRALHRVESMADVIARSGASFAESDE
ncbi:MAG: GAF domain-containing protein [Polyangia bacterium]